MRGLMRLQKNKDKKLKGARKRKEAKISAGVSGTSFKIDTDDSRFASVFEGTDDRFGIDRTDPSFKDTDAMRHVLEEQGRRRRDRKKARLTVVAPDVSAEEAITGNVGSALSSLVKSLKKNVNRAKKR